MLNRLDTPLFQGRRRLLVEELSKRGGYDSRVLRAIATVPRHIFIDRELWDLAYENVPVAIENRQTISQPATVATQTQLLGVKSGDKILEIGTGCGYQTAILFFLGAQVYSIERQKTLYHQALENLNLAGYMYDKIHIIWGDGFAGLPEQAPFDGIIVTCGAPHVPQALLKQLKIGGKMVIPVDTADTGSDAGGQQTLLLITRVGESEFTQQDHGKVSFVPMLPGIERR